MRREKAGWVTWRSAAERLKLLVSTSEMKSSSHLVSMQSPLLRRRCVGRVSVDAADRREQVGQCSKRDQYDGTADEQLRQRDQLEQPAGSGGRDWCQSHEDEHEDAHGAAHHLRWHAALYPREDVDLHIAAQGAQYQQQGAGLPAAARSPQTRDQH